MRSSHLLALSALALAFVTTACSGECEPGTTRLCFTGPDGTMNVGICRAGIERCSAEKKWTAQCEGQTLPAEEACDGTDNDCNGIVDERVRNACGGCPRLEGTPGEACNGCGRWTCEGTDKVVCVPPLQRPGAACDSPDGCPGIFRCGQDGNITCFADSKNACGVCGGPVVDGVGEACTGPSGCAGVVGCTEQGFTICRAPLKNNCGACDGAHVPGVNASCTGPSGCPGIGKCDDSGFALVCDSPDKNACGVCGGPAVEGIGEACGGSGTGQCAGVWACNAAGNGRECRPAGAGTTCIGASGCEGTLQCAQDGSGTVCVAPVENACGTCGGPEITGLGSACTTNGGCEGVTQCNAAGTGTICRVDASCVPTTDHVVISEIAVKGPTGADDEFVELYNPTDAPVNISGWKIWYRPADGTASSYSGANLNLEFPSNTILQPKHFLLAGRQGKYNGTVRADFALINNSFGAAGGQVMLTTPTSSVSASNVVDFVGWGTARKKEGSATAPTHDTAGSIERKAVESSTSESMSAGGTDEALGNGLDTQDNGADFVVRAQRDPQNLQSPAEP